MSAAIPLDVLVADQPQPGLMHQGRGLQGLPRGFLGQPMGSQMAQLLIDQGKQLIGGSGIAMLDGVEDARDLAHWVGPGDAAPSFPPRRRVLLGRSGQAPDQRLGFAHKRVSDDPVAPALTKIAAIELR